MSQRKRGVHGEGRRDILEALKGFIAEHGYSPTVGDLMRAAGFASPNSVTYHLDRLEDEGLVTHVKGVHRSLRLTKTVQSHKRE